MANTYTQLYIHIVFSVKGRESLISKVWKNDLYAYIGGIILNHRSKPLAINGMPDHIHILIGYNPATPLPVLVEEIKTSSNKWIKEHHHVPMFSWQKGYGAFSYSRGSIDKVIHYIACQEEHHRKKTFREEYLQMLRDFEVEYKNEYLFDFQEIYAWS
ncbi:MAG: transposase [Dyadobacter sp. 50-39]|uniref:IS200/IS605 family transposase n=1 Tax=Dyadobacter sp. 50-39 TaxID=1895756 RepID=UPI00095ED325|nr:IS200/IS605 family transposase [Dyadobacter sp. 50-39]OJV21163.1 MAG: transposase [Dyadobacter sp. 50-39]